MLFNSIEFAIFLPIVFTLYWFVANKNYRWQNFLIVISSFVFYGWWDWRFLFLMIFSAGIDFLAGLKIEQTGNQKKKKAFLFLSIFTNLGILGVFKYFNFFIDNFVRAFSFLGYQINPVSLEVILPVGISFYTFQALSYTIDVYKNRLPAVKEPVAYFAYISFFPQLVAGPIERATNLLPQFYKARRFDYDNAVNGLRQILWGLFKKIVIADNCSIYANEIFSNYRHYSGSTLLLGSFFFAFQIYCDFSGYSDIAIGSARLFGFSLMRNFAYPYFSRDIAEFWRRWHISLSTWFRDYVYIPLGGTKVRRHIQIRNILIVFLISGFWHGASWTFIAWGLLNALYFLPLLIFGKHRSNINTAAEGKLLPSPVEFIQISLTFLLTSIAWIFFRSKSLSDSFAYISGIFSKSLFTVPEVFPKSFIAIIMAFVLVEWLQRDKQHALHVESLKIPRLAVWGFYLILILIIFLYGGTQQQFIYFQF
ncbi:MAG: MBOAT family protein [Ignavibacteria bacterium]|nr:MBOAT family protein [Ignavibacteria bacterium]